MPKKRELKIADGSLVLYFCFDIANEIALDKLETVFGQKPVAEQLKLKRIAPKHFQYLVPPVYLALGSRKIQNLKFNVDAKIHDFGVVTLRYMLPISCSLSTLKKYGYELVENETIEEDAEQLLEQIRTEIQSYLIEPNEMTSESYALYFITKFTKPIFAKELLANDWKDIASALCCEEQPLSEQELKESVHEAISYYPNDLVIIDWNAAFVYDPTESYETLDVIEHAVIELLELRTYDNHLDKTLDQAYSDIKTHEHSLFRGSSISRSMGVLSEERIEVLDVIDKVENALKLFGDLYLVKVYQAAFKRFGLESWKTSVDRKLDTVLETYTMLGDQLEGRRMVTMEALILALFVLDIALIFFVGI